MKITCPKCKTKLVFPDETLKPGETRFKCSSCGAVIVYKGKANKPAASTPLPADTPPLPPAAGEHGVDSSVGEGQQETPQPLRTGKSEAEISADSFQNQIKDLSALANLVDEQETVVEQEKVKTYSSPGAAVKPAIPAPEAGKGTSNKTVLIVASISVLLTTLIAIYFMMSGGKTDKGQPPAAVSVAPAVLPPAAQPAPQSAAPAGQPATQSPAGSPSPEPGLPVNWSSITDERAIEIVKRSDALYKRTPVDAIINKWTADNAGKYKISGWQARKVSEQKYLVSYTATGGEIPVGFYFELDLPSGTVQDISKNPELKKQYNVQ